MLRICSAMRTWQILMSLSLSDGVVVAAGGVGGDDGRSACRLLGATLCAGCVAVWLSMCGCLRSGCELYVLV